jgi:hypothetical protein
VQVACPRLYPAGLEKLDLVVRVRSAGRHEPHRPAGCRLEIAFFGKGVEAIERALFAQALEPGPHGIEDRVG